MSVLDQIVRQAKALKGTVIFAEGDEDRTLQAAVNLVKDGICNVYVVSAGSEQINNTAFKNGLDISGLNILIPSVDLLNKKVFAGFIGKRIEKGLSKEEAADLALKPLYFAALYLASGKADACVSGARSNTAEVIRAALHGIGMAPGVKFVSSFFLMVPPEGHPLIKKPLLYADCAVNPSPGSFCLKDIAVATINNFKKLFPGEQVKAVFLSYSTKGSAGHSNLKKIREAVDLTKQHYENDAYVMIDGEMQVDAAVEPLVASRKAPGSPVAGAANVFIFPDLNSGNICYKITERFAGFKAIGPVTQGLAMPCSDLSRGCSSDDIYHVAAITLLQK